MVEKDDWRLRHQEEYLNGVTLTLKQYHPHREDWDHEHCEFCWAKFMDADLSEVLREGYTTADEYYWICPSCFNDFKDTFGWRVE